MSDNINIQSQSTDPPAEPLTREERYLSAIAGVTPSSDIPEKPLTRIEKYLNRIVENGGGGGGSFEPTDEQLAAMNSGITSEDVEQISTNKNNILLINESLSSNNLFNVNTFIANKERNATTGELIDNLLGYGVSDLIPVASNTTLFFSHDSISTSPTYVYAYKDDGTYINRTNGNTTYTTSATTGYISICIKNDKAARFKVEYTKVTPYTPYGIISSNDIAENVEFLKSFEIKGYTNSPLEIIKETAGYTAAFHTVGCIGDSLASGLSTGFKNNVKYSIDFYEHSWGQALARMTGNTYYNFSVGGLSTRTWLESQYATQCYDGEHNCTAYIIGLGQNDMNNSIPIGTIADIKDDYTQNPDTFYGNYGKIIQKIKEMFPGTKPKIFVVTDPLETMETSGYNTAIRAIANKFANTWLIDMYTYGRQALNEYPLLAWKRDAHYNAMGYQYFAWVMATYIDWIVRNNFDYFRNVELIGTEYTYSSLETQ